MKPRNLFFLALGVIFVGLVAFALLRELKREERKLASSLTGTVEVAPELWASGKADIVRTDRLALYLVDPATNQPVALRIVSPLVPPQNIDIGQANAGEGTELSGAFLLVGITDKDGELFKVTAGEVYGRSPAPIQLGTEQVRLVLNEPFRGSLFNQERRPRSGSAAAAPAPPALGEPSAQGKTPMGPRGEAALSIRGEVRVSEKLKGNVDPRDRLVILLFDPELSRPVANKIIPHTLLPQRFSISPPPGQVASGSGKAYDLRILTDKDGQPFNAVPGEVIGRSKQPIPLGTSDLVFELNEPYRR